MIVSLVFLSPKLMKIPLKFHEKQYKGKAEKNCYYRVDCYEAA